MTSASQHDELDLQVARAKAGDGDALEIVVRAVQPMVHTLALRFLWHPQDAEDATQEILIRVITALGTFRAESRFSTWVYRIACNSLLTMKKRRMEQQSLSFEEVGEDLVRGLSDEPLRDEYSADHDLLMQEVRIGCTLAMLQCLDRNHRLAYIVGEILALKQGVAADVLQISPAAFRKRLSRARESIRSFLASRCGLVNPANACRCRKRVATAVELGRVEPSRLQFAYSHSDARRFPHVLTSIRQLEETQRAAALYRSQPDPESSDTFVTWLRTVIVDLPIHSTID